MNPFLCFVHEERKKWNSGRLLSDWRSAHKGLGGKWIGMDKANKAKHVAASKQLKSSYDLQMRLYRKKRLELIKAIKSARLDKRVARKQRKILKLQAKKAKATRKRSS